MTREQNANIQKTLRQVFSYFEQVNIYFQSKLAISANQMPNMGREKCPRTTMEYFCGVVL